MAPTAFEHRSVLAGEVLELLRPAPGEVFVDGTLGGGGHAALVLAATAPDGVLVGLDRDAAALVAAGRHLAGFGARAVLRQARFAELAPVLDGLGIGLVDGMLLDLGVSSHQLDTPQRGFSFRADGPLDMRMTPGEGETAAELLNSREERELARIFREYGEERWAGRIARRIVRERARIPLASTLQLAELVRAAVPGGMAPARIHPATRVFQALRIEVNRELEQLERGLAAGFARLRPGGRLAVISFHSLEDRIVKRYFQDLARGCVCPPQLPVCACGRQPRAELLTRKGLRAGAAEVEENPRARSAVLRGVMRL